MSTPGVDEDTLSELTVILPECSDYERRVALHAAAEDTERVAQAMLSAGSDEVEANRAQRRCVQPVLLFATLLPLIIWSLIRPYVVTQPTKNVALLATANTTTLVATFAHVAPPIIDTAVKQMPKQRSVVEEKVFARATCDHVTDIQSTSAALMTLSPTCSSGSRLQTSQRLLAKKAIYSNNGLFFLRFQPDGSVVVYNCGGQPQYVFRRGRDGSVEKKLSSLAVRPSGVLQLIWTPSQFFHHAGNITIAAPHDGNLGSLLCVDHLRLEDDGTLGLYVNGGGNAVPPTWRRVFTYGIPSNPYSNRSCSECRSGRRLVSSAHVIANKLESASALKVCRELLHAHCKHSTAAANGGKAPPGEAACASSSTTKQRTRFHSTSLIERATISSHRRVIAGLLADVVGRGGGWHLIIEGDAGLSNGYDLAAVRSEIFGHLQSASDDGAALAHVGGCSFFESPQKKNSKCVYAVTREGNSYSFFWTIFLEPPFVSCPRHQKVS